MSESTFDSAMAAFGYDPDGGESAEPAEPVVDTPQGDEPTDQQPDPTPNVGGDTDVASADIDLSDLPEEAQIFLRARQREMERGMHEKFREASELRTQAESAIEFVQALNSDPNFAYQVLSRLQTGLTESGYLQSDQDEFYGTDEFEAQQGSDPYADRISQLEARQQAWADQVYQAQISAHVDNQIAQVRNAHPDWDEDDIQAVVDRGFVTQGDLLKAADLYQAENDRILARYLKAKGSVKTPPRVSSGTQGAEAPKSLQGMTEQERREYILGLLTADEG